MVVEAYKKNSQNNEDLANFLEILDNHKEEG